MMIFNAITGIFKAGSGAAAATTSGIDINATFSAPTMAFARGGMRFMASGGMQFVDRATFLPDFNAIAGEAGREMFAVLARPRMMQIGGMQAAVGEMEGRQMAVVPTSAMGGGGGQSVLIVRMEPGLKGELVEQGAQLGVQIVTEKMGRKNELSDVVRNAAGT